MVQRYHIAWAPHLRPIVDRMALCARFTNDIHLDVRRVPFEKLASLEGGERSNVIRARVEAEIRTEHLAEVLQYRPRGGV